MKLYILLVDEKGPVRHAISDKGMAMMIKGGTHRQGSIGCSVVAVD